MNMNGVLVAGVTSLLLSVLPSGCSSHDALMSGGLTERDSAGVRILTHAGGGFPDTISPVPLLTIGQEGQPDYEFFRISTVASLASGNLVVANGGTHELRFYGPDGRYLRTVGQRGEGPAEFGFLSTLWIGPGDTIAVLDSRRRRIVYFDSTGTLARGQSYAQDLTNQQPDSERPCVFPGLMGLLRDGTRVTSGWGCMMFQGTDGRRPTVFPVDLVRSEEKKRVGVFTFSWVWERASPENPQDFFSIIPFAGNLAFAVGPNHIYISEGTEFEIEIFDAWGQLIGLLREGADPPQVSAADRQAYVDAQAATSRPHPADVPFPDRFGSYSELMLSPENDLWARRYPRPGDSLQYWVVFSPDGRQVRRLVLPDISVESVRDGKIYGYRTDTLGIQTVVVLGGLR